MSVATVMGSRTSTIGDWLVPPPYLGGYVAYLLGVQALGGELAGLFD
jgi:hypothetical protein